MPIPAILPRPKAPGAGVGLAGLGMQPFRPAPMGGQPNAATMAPPMPSMAQPAGVVPPNTRSPFGPIGGPSATQGGPTPPPGGLPGYKPGPASQVMPVGLQALSRVPAATPAAPPVPRPPAPPAPLAPTAPLQPDASGVTPPPGTPAPPPPAPPPAPAPVTGDQTENAPPREAEIAAPTAGSGTQGPMTLQTALSAPAEMGATAPPPRGYDAPTTPTPAPEPTTPIGDPSNRTVLPNPAPPPPRDDGSFETAAPARKVFVNDDWKAGNRGDWGTYFGEDGVLKSLPVGADGQIDRTALAQMLSDAGLNENPEFKAKILEIPDLLQKYREAIVSGDKQMQTSALKVLNDTLDAAKAHGLPFDIDAFVNTYGTPTTGETPPPNPTPGEIGEGGEVTLPGTSLPKGIPDEIIALANGDPELAKALFDWLGHQEGRADRQLAIDSLQQGLGGLLANDPTRKAMYDELAKGTQYTLDPATVEKMKTAGRTMYGEGLTGLDANLRAAAAAAGVPTSNLAALSAQGRQSLLSNLLAGERGTDIEAAYRNQADRQQYFQNLDRAQASLLGPMAAYQGSLASLIAGAPGLANTGNPLAGLAEFRASQDAMDPGAMTSRDWLPVGAGLVGSGLGALGTALSGRR